MEPGGSARLVRYGKSREITETQETEHHAAGVAVRIVTLLQVELRRQVHAVREGEQHRAPDLCSSNDNTPGRYPRDDPRGTAEPPRPAHGRSGTTARFESTVSSSISGGTKDEPLFGH